MASPFGQGQVFHGQRLGWAGPRSGRRGRRAVTARIGSKIQILRMVVTFRKFQIKVTTSQTKKGSCSEAAGHTKRAAISAAPIIFRV